MTILEERRDDIESGEVWPEEDCPHDTGVYQEGIYYFCNECERIAPWSKKRRP